MNKRFYSIPAAFFLSALLILTGCKVGEDDPVLSLQSRDNRIAEFWSITEVSVNGDTEQKNGELTWDIRDNNTIIQTTNGTFFGFSTQGEDSGSWQFANDKSDLVVTLDGDPTSFTIDRLAAKDLWVSRIEGNDVYEFRFENR